MLAEFRSPSGERVQFFREQVYAIASSQPGKRRSGRVPDPTRTIEEILKEALRIEPEKHCKHVPSPRPPTVLHGKGVEELLGELAKPQPKNGKGGLKAMLKGIDEFPGKVSPTDPGHAAWRARMRAWARKKWGWIGEHAVAAHDDANAKDSTRHGKPCRVKQMRNVPTLLAAVASYPEPPDSTDVKYLMWRVKVIEMAKAHYGEANILSIVEHLDEGHGHCHVLVSRSDAKPIKALHAGHGRVLQAKGHTAPSKLGRVYRVGTKKLQRLFWKMVGEPCGLKRLSEEPYAREPLADVRAKARLKGEVAQFVARNAKRIDDAIEPLREQLGDEMTNDIIARLRHHFELEQGEDDGVFYVAGPAKVKPAKGAPPVPAHAKEPHAPAAAAPAKDSPPKASPAKGAHAEVAALLPSAAGLPQTSTAQPTSQPKASPAKRVWLSEAKAAFDPPHSGLPPRRAAAGGAPAAQAPPQGKKKPMTDAEKKLAQVQALNRLNGKAARKAGDRERGRRSALDVLLGRNAADSTPDLE